MYQFKIVDIATGEQKQVITADSFEYVAVDMAWFFDYAVGGKFGVVLRRLQQGEEVWREDQQYLVSTTQSA